MSKIRMTAATKTIHRLGLANEKRAGPTVTGGIGGDVGDASDPVSVEQPTTIGRACRS
jgi:hypothetical protein